MTCYIAADSEHMLPKTQSRDALQAFTPRIMRTAPVRLLGFLVHLCSAVQEKCEREIVLLHASV